MDRDDPAYKGQADYSPLLLKLYDPIVIGFVAWLVWRCPADPILDGYRRLIRDNHLDIGPGTGYCIDKSSLPDGSRVTDPSTPTRLSLATPRGDCTGSTSPRSRPMS